MRPQVAKRLTVFALVSAAAVGYAGTRYARLTDHVISTSYSVDVDLAESGGIFEGAEVTYRGVPVGKVGEVGITRDGIRVELEIGNEWDIPASASAHVHNRSAVGEQYVDLVPTSADEPFLEDGDNIERARTTIPLAEEVLIEDTRDFAASVPLADLRTVVSELGRGFEGAGPDIARLIEGSDLLIETAAAHLPQTVSLLRSSATVLRTQNESASSIQSFARDLADFSGALSASDGDLRKTVRQTAGFAAETRRLLADSSQGLNLLLKNLTILNSIGATHLPHIESALVALPWSLNGMVIDQRNNRGQFVTASSNDPVGCKAGYLPPTRWRSAQDYNFVVPNYSVQCREGAPTLMRGSQRRVGPTG